MLCANSLLFLNSSPHSVNKQGLVYECPVSSQLASRGIVCFVFSFNSWFPKWPWPCFISIPRMRRKLDNQGSHRPPSDPASDEFIFTALVTSLDTTFAVGRINQGSWCKTLKHWWVFGNPLPSFSMLPLSIVSVLLQGSASPYTAPCSPGDPTSSPFLPPFSHPETPFSPAAWGRALA